MNVIVQSVLSLVLGIGGMIVGATIVGEGLRWLAGNEINNLHSVIPTLVLLAYLIGGAAGLIGGFKLRERISRAIASRHQDAVRDV